MNEAVLVSMQEDIRDLHSEIIKLELAVKLLIERQEKMIELVQRIAGKPMEIG